MPNGLQTVIAAVSHTGDEEKHYSAIRHMPALDKMFIDVGSQALSTLVFTLRDYDGNLIPLTDHNWSMVLSFGYIE